jgi:HSP20 family protein
MEHLQTTPAPEQEHRALRAPGAGESYVVPPVDIYETDKGYAVVADMPGVQPDGLDIHVDHDRLTIRGRVTAREQTSPLHREFVLHDYYRAFTLAQEIDSEKISAMLRDGVLRLELPKAARAVARKISVGAA